MNLDSNFHHSNNDDDDINSCYDNQKLPARVSDVTFDVESISVRKTYHQGKPPSRCLLTMAIGCVFDGKPLYDINKPPFVGAANKALFKPNKTSMKAEVNRRYMIKNNGREKKCSSFTIDQLIQNLVDNPITYLNDVEYLKKQIDLLSIQLESKQSDDTGPTRSTGTASPWNSYKHYLRLYHCLMIDDIRIQYMEKDRAKSRGQMEAMRSFDMREKTVYENIATLYNDKDFNPISLDLGGEHSMFAKQVALPHSTSPVPIDGEKVKQKLADCRCKMMIVKSKFDASGIGEGSICDDGNGVTFVHGGRAAFLGDYPPHILYYWEVLTREGLLECTLAELSSESECTATKAPSTSKKYSKKSPIDADVEETKKMTANIASAMTQFTAASSSSEARNQEAEKRADAHEKRENERAKREQERHTRELAKDNAVSAFEQSKASLEQIRAAREEVEKSLSHLTKVTDLHENATGDRKVFYNSEMADAQAEYIDAKRLLKKLKTMHDSVQSS